MKSLRYASWIILILCVIFLDQLTKHQAINHLEIYVPHYINAIINLTLARNTGAAFSFLDSASGWQTSFFLCLNIIISLFLFIWLLKLPSQQKIKAAGLSLILGGAIGNIIDRIQLGYVVDFLDFHYKNWHWPIFNIADSAVCVGVFLLILSISKEEK